MKAEITGTYSLVPTNAVYIFLFVSSIFLVRPSMQAAHMFWTVWALVQAEYSTIDFDYIE